MKGFLKVICAVLILGFVACEEERYYGTQADTTIESLGTPDDHEIWFTTTGNNELMYIEESAFDAAITDIIYSEYGINVIQFDKPVTTIGKWAFRDCYNLFNLSLPNSVTTIGDEAFYNCTNMECLTLGNGLLACGERAFDNCIALHSLHIPSSKSWCNISFSSKTANPVYFAQQLIVSGNKIKEFSVPNGIKSINEYAFAGYTYLTSITIPASVKEIGIDAFIECEGLSSVIVDDLEAWCSVSLGNETANPISIAGTLYSNGNIVTDLSLDNVMEIKDRAFIRCASIKTLRIGDAVKVVGMEAFRGCSLTRVIIGKGTTEIIDRAFMGCQQLSNVSCGAVEPPILGNNVFDYNAEGRKIYVPSEAINAYKNDANWNKYADSIETMN